MIKEYYDYRGIYYGNQKTIEVQKLFAWSEFYQGSANLAVRSKVNLEAFIKVQKEINKFQKEYYK